MNRRADAVTGSGSAVPGPEHGSGVGPASNQTEAAANTWPLSSSLMLGALPTAVGCARLHARSVMGEWGLGAFADNVELVVSELVTNAVLASTGPDGRPVYPDNVAGLPVVRLRLSSDRAGVLIEVWDMSRQAPIAIATHADPQEEGGRGLMLVEALCERWSWDVSPGWAGKVVWAEFRRP
jgi:anti-sigma regulatory factor (Ser/Thr protein kinase)